MQIVVIVLRRMLTSRIATLSAQFEDVGYLAHLRRRRTSALEPLLGTDRTSIGEPLYEYKP